MSARRKVAWLIPAVGLSMALASPAMARQPGDGETSRPPQADTTADRFGFFEGEQLQVTTGTEDDNLTFRIALPTGPATESRFSLSLATPLQGGGDNMPASLDALANGSRITLSWGYFPLRTNRDTDSDGIYERAREKCLAKPDPAPLQCDVSTHAVYHHYRENWLRYLRLTTLNVTDWGVDATLGINEFEWVDPVTLTPQKAQRTDWSVAGHVTHYLAGRQLALTGSVSYQRAYEAADEQLLCPPNPVDPATQCMTARGAAPGRNENLLISAGLRYRTINAEGTPGRFAIAPMVNYDVIDDVWGVDVPIYLIPGPNGSLNGGIRLGYRSDREDRFSIGVFVGTTFNYLGGGS